MLRVILFLLLATSIFAETPTPTITLTDTTLSTIDVETPTFTEIIIDDEEETPTFTETITSTFTVTLTGTITPTSTITLTSTITPTFTITSTPTSTPTFIPKPYCWYVEMPLYVPDAIVPSQISISGFVSSWNDNHKKYRFICLTDNTTITDEIMFTIWMDTIKRYAPEGVVIEGSGNTADSRFDIIRELF